MMSSINRTHPTVVPLLSRQSGGNADFFPIRFGQLSAKLFGLAVAAGAVAMTALLRGRPIPECNARQRTA
jgi:hypothetical protein